ncbi:hypothetical protein QBC30_005093 [Citrobacter freundii]|uniref:hypothetical protein n=1 Tax=Citrobacter freundii TaxID=546 RepID=UPI0008FCE658|nr:hypothetical protein [Citrobacter freundii]EKV4070310.1 hypothetical protein [Citrobacter freundii]EKV5130852.1 hypothetical protein [Citrobacter freundii]EKW1514613.1 hypothetical protein [Citrobacter freundii]ELZ9359402.1 hypothetical protein [Citrobacter freundii]MCC2941258.1 hypothetical protein [Citrobacter freundii]
MRYENKQHKDRKSINIFKTCQWYKKAIEQGLVADMPLLNKKGETVKDKKGEVVYEKKLQVSTDK